MTTIRSTWTQPTPPPLTGLLAAADWSNAATMAIPRGTLLARNDATHLYIGLDLTAETGPADPSDYFWFVVDINDNGVIDPNRDKLFSDWPGDPSRLGMWLMAGPDETWGASDTQVIPSQLRQGYGASTGSATPHRQWQIVFALSDLGITFDPTAPPPVVRFGLRIASTSFVGETPTNPLGSFGDFNEIVLSLVPSALPGSLGPVIGSVGVIGAGFIGADGYCTIPAATPYYINPQAAAFAGTMNLIGNQATLLGLWASGARTYKVLHRFGNTAAAVAAATWTPILQSWANFAIVGLTDVWQSFGPDASGLYTMVDPSLPYTIQDLVFQWTTSSEPDGLHQFQLQFFNAAGVPVTTSTQVLTLKLDNQLATVSMKNVLFEGAPIPPCSIVSLTAATPGVQLVYEAFDPEGDLYSYTLTAAYGDDQVATVYADSCSDHLSLSNPNDWQGVSSATQPATSPPGWVPPISCAYAFQVAATKRTTDGYEYPGLTTSAFQTVTLMKANVVFKPLPKAIAQHVAPAGFPTLKAAQPGARVPVKALPVKV